MPELRTLLKQKILTLGRLNGEEMSPETEITKCMQQIYETFFSESKVRVIRRFVQTSKLMKGLVHLVYAFMCLTLNLEREFSFDNLLGLTELPSIKPEDVKQMFSATLLSSHASQVTFD